MVQDEELFINIHTHTDTKEKNVLKIVNLFPGAENIKNNYYSAGIHPWFLTEDYKKDLESIKLFLKNEKVIAIGEAGMDNVKGIEPEFQEKVFIEQAELGELLGKPLIIHCVRAYNPLLRIRKEKRWKQPWLFHAFNSSPGMAKALTGAACYLCFGQFLFSNNGNAAFTFKDIPLHFIFLETDESKHSIVEVYEQAAKLKDMQLKELKIQINHNFEKCFPHL